MNFTVITKHTTGGQYNTKAQECFNNVEIIYTSCSGCSLFFLFWTEAQLRPVLKPPNLLLRYKFIKTAQQKEGVALI